MKNIFAFLSAMAVFAAVAAEGTLSLAEARGKIGDAVVKPAVMTSTMKQLSADDQKAFLADVNEAIDKMPGSVETKSAAYLNANRAALKGAAKGNLAALLAEVFATVPPEALTVLNERFAADLFNRAADPSVVYSDEQFVNIAETVMTSVTNRTAATDGAAVRSAFAVLMLARASNGTPPDLVGRLTGFLPEDSRKIASEEWIPEALGENRNYNPMLGMSNAGVQPNSSLVLQIAGPQVLESMLADINSPIAGPGSANAAAFRNASEVVTTLHVATPDIGTGSGLDRRPFHYPRGAGGGGFKEITFREPDGYQWQTISIKVPVPGRGDRRRR